MVCAEPVLPELLLRSLATNLRLVRLQPPHAAISSQMVMRPALIVAALAPLVLLAMDATLPLIASRAVARSPPPQSG